MVVRRIHVANNSPKLMFLLEWCTFTQSGTNTTEICKKYETFLNAPFGIAAVTFNQPQLSNRTCVTNVSSSINCPLVKIKLVRDYGSRAVNLIRPISSQPFLQMLNSNGIKIFTIGTYFHRRQGRRTEKVLSRHGYYFSILIFYENFLKANLNTTDIRFTDLTAMGNGNGYKIGFLLQYQDPVSKNTFCDTINSNTELTILDSVSVIYTNPMTWIGFSILIISIFVLTFVPLICKFKDSPKGRSLYFRCGKSLRNIIGYDHEMYFYYSCFILVAMIIVLFLAPAVLIPTDLLGKK
eukprot:gene604-8108_t